MQIVLDNFIRGYYHSEFSQFGDETCINWMPLNTSGGKWNKLLVPTPATEELFSEVVQDEQDGKGVRALYTVTSGAGGQPTLYAVFGRCVYRMGGRGGPVFCGRVTAGASKISICENATISGDNSGQYLYICDGLIVWRLDIKAKDDDVSLSFKSISMPFRPGSENQKILPREIAFYEQRLIVLADGNFWFYSDIASDTFNDLSFYSAEQSIDEIQTLSVLNGLLYLCGTKTVEVWASTGVQNNPFALRGGSAIQLGAAGVNCASAIDDNLFILGSSGFSSIGLFQISGSNSVRVSTDGIEPIFAEWGQYSAFCRVESWREDGQSLVSVTSPDFRRTLVYSLNTQQWHERSSLDEKNNDDKWCARSFTNYNFGVVCGTDTENLVLKLTDSTSTEHTGKNLIRRRKTPIVHAEMDNFIINEVTLDCPKGQGASIGLRVSRDGGMTFGDDRVKTLGGIGVYNLSAHWYSMGMAKDCVFELFTNDPKPIPLFALRLNISKCGRV